MQNLRSFEAPLHKYITLMELLVLLLNIKCKFERNSYNDT